MIQFHDPCNLNEPLLASFYILYLHVWVKIIMYNNVVTV